jgi:hypothetical protein
MHSEEEKLTLLADKVVEGLSSQPRDEQPTPKAGVKIKGNNGSINFGTQYNIGTLALGGGNSGGDEPEPIRRWTVEELNASLAYYRAQWWSGWRGFWLNIPCVLMLLLPFGVAGSLFAGILPIRDSQSMWLVLVLLLPTFTGLGFWLANIRRIESRVMAESQAAIDEIRTELRCRR